MGNKTIILFDMDGTLTPPRQRAEKRIIESLTKLLEVSDIGIITGSDFEYIEQQVPELLDFAGKANHKIDLLPCNGTKRYTFIDGKGYDLVSSVNIIDEIGKVTYEKILKLCLSMQAEIMERYEMAPFTGTFLQYRKSLLNWCPIGRDASNNDRRRWVDIDEKEKIREKYQQLIQLNLDLWESNMTVALGGSTSFDIYPEGWDKTFGLKYYIDKDMWFIGDRCKPGGNDWHIYEALKPYGRSYETTGPAHTIKLIDSIISTLSKK